MPVTPAEGQRVGNYVLTRKIAAGACGEVWAAQHHAWADKVVAVKIPTDPQYVRNLQNDGAAMHGLRHPAIVEAVDFDPYADPPYLAMEYVPGSSLRPLIEGRKLDVPQAVAVLRQVLAALGHAHANGIVHRDIKPENILIHERAFKQGFSAEGVVKVTDFGLGHIRLASGSIELSTSLAGAEARHVVGTLAYMAPEIEDGRLADARVDLYACGVVFFEMLTGRKPHGPDLPSKTNKSVPKHLDDAFSRSYARLDERYASAEEFLTGLDEPAALPSIPVASHGSAWGGLAAMAKRVFPSPHPTDSAAPWSGVGDAAADAGAGVAVLSRAAPPALSILMPDVWTNALSMMFQRIKPGRFLMGSAATEEGHFDNEAQHEVTLTRPFRLGIHPVTRGQFAAFAYEAGYETEAEKEGWGHAWTRTNFERVRGASWKVPGFDQTDDHPVVEISWKDAMAFCAWLSAKDAMTYRLPTEAQWEYACRAGTETAYFWGDNPDGGDGYANFQGLPVKEEFNFTSPVGSFQPNAWGLYDMNGNVWEWCSDASGDYSRDAVVDPTGPRHNSGSSGPSRVLRGGSWYSDPLYCRAAYRLWSSHEPRDYNFGFRVCLDL